MEFRLACGHTTHVHPWEDFFSVIRRHPKGKGGAVCMCCYLEAKAAEKGQPRG